MHDPCHSAPPSSGGVSAARFLTEILDLAQELTASARKTHNLDHREFCCKAARDFHAIVAQRIERLAHDAPGRQSIEARITSLDVELTAFDT